jgi:hypothetical protein
MKNLMIMLSALMFTLSCTVPKSQRDCEISISNNYRIIELNDTISSSLNYPDSLEVLLDGDTIVDYYIICRTTSLFENQSSVSIDGNDDGHVLVHPRNDIVQLLPGQLVQNCKDISGTDWTASKLNILIEDSITNFDYNQQYRIGIGLKDGNIFEPIFRFGYIQLSTLNDDESIVIEKIIISDDYERPLLVHEI